ncbi:hypothetical protein [Neobacillus niacini]
MKKETDRIPPNQENQEENVNTVEKSPEFDVFGTAINDLHSPFEF